MSIWKTLIYNGEQFDFYEASEDGRIRSVGRTVNRGRYSAWQNGKILSTRTNNIEPHRFTEINNNQGERKTVYVHKAVFETFGGILKEYVSFMDETPTNCNFSNLYSVNHSELQIRNMKNNPKARQRLANINRANGYYDIVGRPKISKDQIEVIQRFTERGTRKEIIAKLAGCSISSVYKYLNDNKQAQIA